MDINKEWMLPKPVYTLNQSIQPDPWKPDLPMLHVVRMYWGVNCCQKSCIGNVYDRLGIPQYFKWGNLQGQAFVVDRIRKVQSAITIDRYFCGKLTID